MTFCREITILYRKRLIDILANSLTSILGLRSKNIYAAKLIYGVLNRGVFQVIHLSRTTLAVPRFIASVECARW